MKRKVTKIPHQMHTFWHQQQLFEKQNSQNNQQHVKYSSQQNKLAIQQKHKRKFQKMNNQKTSTSLHPEFIRKHKRRQSPKHKNQNLYNFKCPHKEHINAKQKEEYHLEDNQSIKDDIKLVFDLKQQLSHLKQEVAKIAQSKLQTAQNDQNTSKIKMLDFYFPDKNHKKQSNLTPKSVKTQDNKTQENDVSLEKQSKKFKSKDRLKFSKFKKVQKFSPISSAKKKQTDSNAKSIQSQQLIKQEQKHRTKSGDQSTLEDDIKKISVQHKSRLEDNIRSLVFQQENLSINIERDKFIQQSKESSTSLGIRGQDIVSPQRKQSVNDNASKQIVSPRGGHIVSSQMKTVKLKRLIQQQQLQISTLKRVILQKSETLKNYETQLQQTKTQIFELKTWKHTQQTQIFTFKKQLFPQKQQNSHQNAFLQLKQFLIDLKLDNKKLKQTLQATIKKLQCKQLQITRISQLNQSLTKQLQNINNQNSKIIEALKKQFTIKQNSLLEEINKNNQILKELKINEKVNQSNITQNQSSIIKPQKQLTLSTLSPNSPRGSITPTNREKELINVIKLHQKSLQNYQKDLIFLESQCKNLHQFKILSKKQQVLIKQTNHLLLTHQLTQLNLKYQKIPLSFSPAHKQLPKRTNKEKSSLK